MTRMFAMFAMIAGWRMSKLYGRKVAAARADYGMRQIDLARSVDVTQTNISLLERRINPCPNTKLLFKIADVFGCDVQYLIDDKIPIFGGG